jgi:putative aminopeptidase FrvX
MVQIHAVSGYEDDMIRFVYQQVSSLVDEAHIDGMGNVIAIKHGTQADAPRVLFSAHVDEVGFMVRRINADGTLGLFSLHGNPKVLPGHTVQIRTTEGQLVHGVIGIKSAHLTTPSEWERGVDLDALFVYVEDTSPVVQIQIADTVSFAPDFRHLQRDRISSKSLDNRVGCAVLLAAMKNLAEVKPASTTAFVFSVQEEISCDGVLAPAQAFGATFVIGVDGTVSYDTPDTPALGSVRLGKGPVITRMLLTHGLNSWCPNPKLAHYLETVAQVIGVPTQRDAVSGLMTDIKPLRLGGIPSALIGIPMLGKHSPAEVVALSDVEACVELTSALVSRFDGSLDIRRGS